MDEPHDAEGLGGKSVNDVLEVVSGYRRYSMFLFVLMSVCVYAAIGSQQLNIVFIGFVSPHHCQQPENISVSAAIPRDKHGELEKCTMYANHSDNASTVTCQDGWDYQPVYGEKTIIMEWDLVCNFGYIPELSQSLFSCGSLVGQLFAGFILDRFGRKWVPVICYVVVASLGTALTFTQTFYSFIIIRACTALFTSTCWISTVTLVAELFSRKERAFVTMFFEYGWCLGYLHTVFVAYLVPDWRMMQLIYSLVSLLGLVTVIVPESPYWLLANGHKDEAERVLQKIARLNNVKVNGQLIEKDQVISLTDKEDEQPMSNHESATANEIMIKTVDNGKYPKAGEETFWDLIKDPLLRRSLLTNMAMFFANSVIYFYTVLGVSIFGGNLYLNFLLGGTIEFPGYALAYFISKRGRRIPGSLTFLTCGVIFLCLTFTPKQTASGVDLTPLHVTYVLIIRLMLALMFCNSCLYGKELFPTNLRATGLALGSVVGQLGIILAPMAVLWARKVSWLPNIVFGIMSLVVALLILRLPETLHWPLPQSIADVHYFTAGGHERRRPVHRAEEKVQTPEM